MKTTRTQKEERLQAEAQAVIEEFLNWEEQAERPNLTQLEDVILRLRERLGVRMAEVAIADQEAQQPVAGPKCAACGAVMRYKGQKGAAVESRIGGLALERGYYYCARCRSGLFPPGQSA
jgi:hypothetical protein